MLFNYQRLCTAWTNQRITQLRCKKIETVYYNYRQISIGTPAPAARTKPLKALLQQQRQQQSTTLINSSVVSGGGRRGVSLLHTKCTAGPPITGCGLSMLRRQRLLDVAGRWTRQPCFNMRQRSSRGSATKVKIQKSDFARLMTIAKSEKYILLVAMGCLIVSSAITMSLPFVLGKMIDFVFTSKEDQTNENMKKLALFSLALTGIFVIGSIANYWRVYLFNGAAMRIVRNLRSRVYRSMLLQETSWYDTRGTGELINRLVNDTFFVGNSLSQNLSDGMRAVAMMTVGTGMMFTTSLQLAIASTVVVPAISGMAIVYGRYVRKITRELLDEFANISKHAEERFGNIKTVKSFCREFEESAKYDRMIDTVMDVGYKEVRAKSIFFGLTGFTGNVTIVTVLHYGGYLVMAQALTIGELTSFLMYAGYVAMSMNTLSNFYSELNKGVGAAQRIWEILDRQYAIPIEGGLVPTQKPAGEMIFKNVVFNYPSRMEIPVLNDFNLKLMPGKTTAIVGRSGSGKTTIGSLLMRLYDPTEGTVLLDGVDLRTLNPQWLRSHISTVSQEPVLFSGTIRDNILYGLNPGVRISEEQFLAVVHEAHVDEFVANLPDGLNTLVGQRGMMLSGGQKQRVAIARALIKNPTIILLDEATSALDAVSENLVQNSINRLVRGRTVLTIAHRLSTIRNADHIAVMDNGRIIEEGSYDKLMGTNEGAFKDLVSKQTFKVQSI